MTFVKKLLTVAIVDSPIDRFAVIASVESARAGAIATFDGTVRDHSRKKAVTHLFYQAYAPMALKEMERIRRRALQRWPLEAAAVVHRIGRLEIGESSVFIAVSSAHRADAFAACRFIIDALKTSVPIWKKEHYQDGEVWIEGYNEKTSAGAQSS